MNIMASHLILALIRHLIESCVAGLHVEGLKLTEHRCFSKCAQPMSVQYITVSNHSYAPHVYFLNVKENARFRLYMYRKPITNYFFLREVTISKVKIPYPEIWFDTFQRCVSTWHKVEKMQLVDLSAHRNYTRRYFEINGGSTPAVRIATYSLHWYSEGRHFLRLQVHAHESLSDKPTPLLSRLWTTVLCVFITFCRQVSCLIERPVCTCFMPLHAPVSNKTILSCHAND